MTNRIICKLACLIIFFTALCSQGFGQFEEGQATIQSSPIIGAAIIPGAIGTNTYTSFSEGVNRKITNVVTFKINEKLTSLFFKSNFTATVYLKIESWKVSNPLSTTIQTQFQSLTVNYDTIAGAKYNVRSYLVLDTSQQVTITVDTITITGNVGWDPKPALFLESEMRIIRYYKLSNLPAALTPKTLTCAATEDELNVSWTYCN